MKFVNLLIFIMLSYSFCVFNAYPISWIVSNEIEIAWDAVDTLEDGKPIPDGWAVWYTVYYMDLLEQPKMHEHIVTNETRAKILITVNPKMERRPRYILGVQAMTINPEGNEKNSSSITWSNEPAPATDEPFGLEFFDWPQQPINIRVK